MLSDIAATLTGGIFGAGITIFKMMMQNSHDQKMRDCDNYYRYMAQQTSNESYMWTRRLLALIIVGFIPVALTVGAIKGWPIIIGYQETNGFFSSMFNGGSDIYWKTFHGYVFPPAIWFLAGQVISSYFVGKPRG